MSAQSFSVERTVPEPADRRSGRWQDGTPVVVQKYGGSSLADADAVRAVARRVAEDHRRVGALVVVVSAMGDTTDRLLDLARELCADPSGRELAALLATGEQTTTALLTLAIQGLGVPAVSLTGAQCGIVTEGAPLAADIVEVRTRRLREELARGRVAVVAGFQGVDGEGRTTTLGRGGSDTTAVALAAALGAERCEIYTDVAGVFSADPRLVPVARRLPTVDPEGMEELAYQGSGVLEARAVELARRNGVELLVASARERNGSTAVREERAVSQEPAFRPRAACALGISARSDLLRLRYDPARLSPARLSELHERLRPLDVIFLHQGDSGVGGTGSRVYVSTADMPCVDTFRAELDRRFEGEVEPSEPLAAATLVGLERETRKGVISRALEVMSERRLEVVELFTSRRSITFVLRLDELERTVRELHRCFVETPAPEEPRPLRPHGNPGERAATTVHRASEALDLYLLGCGNVGRRVATLVTERSGPLRERLGFEIRVAALCDRSGYLVRDDAGDNEALLDLVRRKTAGEAVASLTGAVADGSPIEMVRAAHRARSGASRPILVDVSDADAAVPVFLEALALGCDVVTANKKPLAGDAAAYRELLRAGRGDGRRVRGEATVGAGLPVIDTLEMLRLTGDRIERIEGCLSGTLSSLMSWMEEGLALSEAVERAVERGYTEPDPAADLTGADVARKAVILGRVSGLVDPTAGETPIRLTGLVDESFAGLPAERFFERLRREVDGPMARRVEACREQGEVLRYVARIAAGSIEVGPVPVPRSSELGSVRGPDNVVVFHSERYSERPLTVSGPGAGVDVTAMAVLTDILRIAVEARGER